MSTETGLDIWLIIIMILAFVFGVVFLLGKGDRFLKDSSADQRNREFDMKKAQRGYGVAFVAIGAASLIGFVLDTTLGYILYMVITVGALIGSVVYMQKCCRK